MLFPNTVLLVPLSNAVLLLILMRELSFTINLAVPPVNNCTSNPVPEKEPIFISPVLASAVIFWNSPPPPLLPNIIDFVSPLASPLSFNVAPLALKISKSSVGSFVPMPILLLLSNIVNADVEVPAL